MVQKETVEVLCGVDPAGLKDVATTMDPSLLEHLNLDGDWLEQL